MVEALHVFGMVKGFGTETDEFDVEFVCSTDVVDRSDEVIVQEGWMLEAFKSNPVFLAAHMHRLDSGHSSVIGSFADVGVKDGQLVGRVKFADTELGREYKELYRGGHMRAVSVGFIPKEGGNKTVAGKKIYHHTKAELIEVSAVPVPCNQEALARYQKELKENGAMSAVKDQLAAALAKALADAGISSAQSETPIAEVLASFEKRLDEKLGYIDQQIEDLRSLALDTREQDELGDGLDEFKTPASTREDPADTEADSELTRAANDLIRL